jgi:hypothetical protein
VPTNVFLNLVSLCTLKTAAPPTKICQRIIRFVLTIFRQKSRRIPLFGLRIESRVKMCIAHSVRKEWSLGVAFMETHDLPKTASDGTTWVSCIDISTGETFRQCRSVLHSDGLPEAQINNGATLVLVMAVSGLFRTFAAYLFRRYNSKPAFSTLVFRRLALNSFPWV